VDIIDCAVPHHTPANIAVRMAIIREAARAGKAVLMQKPLSYDLETAEQMVKIAEDGGISLAVNQNLRFDPAIYATKQLLSAERFGDPGVMTFANLSTTGPKFGFTTDGVIIGWQIHAIDSLRWFAGADAISVYSTNRNNGSLYQIEFASGALATFTEYHNEGTFRNETPFRIWAANGAIRGNHRWNPGSRWEPDLVEVRGYDWPKEIDWVTYRLPDDPSYQEVFVKPDYEVSASIGGFIGMMGEFMQSLHEGRLAVTNARDNLMSLRTYFAGQLSAEQRRPVDPRDMTLL
jgi:predicted dehydrogenase